MKYQNDVKVRVLLPIEAINADTCTLPKALWKHLWNHTMGTIQRDHLILSIFQAPKEEVIKVRAAVHMCAMCSADGLLC